MSHTAEWMLLFVCVPGIEPEPAGVLLLDRDANRLSVKLNPRPSLAQTDESILEVWQYLAAELASKAKVYGGAEVMAWLESAASHTFQVSDRKLLEAADLRSALQQLYMEHVGR